MSQRPTCPSCGAALPPRSPRNLCPRCLFQAGLENDAPAMARNGAKHAVTFGLGATDCGVLDSIGAKLDSIPRVLLRDTDGGTEPPLHRPDAGNDLRSGTRYRIDGEIARGGMGTVLMGRDPDLGRDVALKILREDLRDNPEMVRRFVEEAQIGGQLQHPGIVPIYELGCFGDRRPFFAMKLVKGRTLAQLLADRTARADGLPRFLSIFEAIAQTVAYAHARGVIHRDLKPSNVMVGSFGEVQVMDWGLAKVLPRGGVVDDAQARKPDRQQTVIATGRSGSGDSELSHAGSAMGTPSYMAPEQARGEVDRIDERADVFALGSILCEVLTGEAAFLGRSGGEIQRKAALGDLADATARLDACGADGELVALAKGCLAREPEDRPRAAGAVAERVTAYLAGVQEKLRRAELERVEERARRRLTTVAAAALILLGLAAGGGYTWSQQQKAARVAKTARAVDEALADAARLRGEAQAAPPGETARWAEALSAAKRAQGLLAQGEADAALKGRVAALLAGLNRAQADAAEKARRLEVDRALLADLESARGNLAEHGKLTRIDAEYAAAFRKAGLDLDTTEPAEAGKWLAARSEPVELAGYLDDWAVARGGAKRPAPDWRRLVAAARAADPDRWRDTLRARVGTIDAVALAEFRRLADDEKALDAQSAPSLILLAVHLKFGAGDRERAARVLRRAVSRHPADFWARIELSEVHGAGAGEWREIFPQPEDSVRHLTAAVAIRPGSPMAHENLGLALAAQGKLDEAIAEAREAIRLKPDLAMAHSSLGLALAAQGKIDEAVAAHRQAIRLEPDSVSTYINLGNALLSQGKPDLAVAAYREAIRLKPDVAVAHSNLGIVLIDQGNLDEAVAEIRAVGRLKPDNAIFQYGLGNRLEQIRRYDDALEVYRLASRLDGKHVGSAILSLAGLLGRVGRYEDAARTYDDILRMLKDDPRPDIPAKDRRGEIQTRLVELDRFKARDHRFTAVVREHEHPANVGERLDFARMSHDRGFHASAARLWELALQANPELGDDRQAKLRYHAACAAALASAGRGKDDPPSDLASKAKLRAQALAWLKAELVVWAKLLDGGDPKWRAQVDQTLQGWKGDTDLTPVRSPQALAKLPEAERKEWQALWAEVDVLLKLAARKTP